jgi:8-oxo-dGTP pyrophosphatase MutT (NUDIX family)
MTERWQRKTRKTVFDSPWIRLYKDEYVLLDQHGISDYFIWESGDSALCVCKVEEDKVLLTRQYRPGIEKYTVCHPGGRLEPSDISPISGATREMLEETGHVPRNITPLGSFGQVPAITPNRIHIFLVQCEPSPNQPALEPSEKIDVELVPIPKLQELIASGEMDCVACVAATYLALGAIK